MSKRPSRHDFDASPSYPVRHSQPQLPQLPPKDRDRERSHRQSTATANPDQRVQHQQRHSLTPRAIDEERQQQQQQHYRQQQQYSGPAMTTASVPVSQPQVPQEPPRLPRKAMLQSEFDDDPQPPAHPQAAYNNSYPDRQDREPQQRVPYHHYPQHHQQPPPPPTPHHPHPSSLPPHRDGMSYSHPHMNGYIPPDGDGGYDENYYQDPDAPATPPDPIQDDFYQPDLDDPNNYFPNASSPYGPPGQARSSSPQVGGASSSQPPPPLLDHSHLRPGNQAALLSHDQTLELYRANAKKTQDPDLQFEFAVFMIDASKSMPIPEETPGNIIEVEKALEKRDDLVREATALLKRLADRGHAVSQYFLADCYANGIGTVKNRQDFDRAYPLFVLSAKHGHPDAAYRAGTCCENGWGCRRESAKAVQFFRKAAAALHPGAMYRLGVAELNGELGLSKHPKEGVKWLKRSAEHATGEFPHAIHELALLHERGVDNVVFVDTDYAAELLAQAAELGYSPSAYRLGECYEYGKMGCPQDPALSIHYYNIAAQQNHRDACFALTAWYLVGSPGVLPQSDTEAYLWARRAAEAKLVKAMYAVGYFLEVGIGTTQNLDEALEWYNLAADKGDKRAIQRLRTQHAPMPRDGGPGSVLREGLRRDELESGGGGGAGGRKDKDCVIM